jgi:hypothetical protein
MNKIRIQGLVKHANSVRDELSGPLSTVRVSQIEAEVKSSMKSLEKIFHRTNSTSKHLPPQSKKAYDFLSNIDFSSIETTEHTSKQRFRSKSVSLTGVKAYFESILDRLSLKTEKDDFAVSFRSIVNSSNNIEQKISSEGFEPEHLTDVSRNIRGWLAYFSQKNNLIRYTESIQAAKDIFRKYPLNGKNTIVHLCPLKGLYRTRHFSDCILVKLPTAMIAFDQNHFVFLAEMIFDKKNHKKELLEAVQSEQYQAVLQDIELLAGIIERTKGLYFDLEESFNRVNNQYFNGNIPKPRLVWSRTFNCRKFGHYDIAHEIVMVNSSLDNPEVGVFTVDFIMYHELLHKKLGAKSNGKNIIFHDREFRRQEKMFAEFNKARRQLSSLTRK